MTKTRLMLTAILWISSAYPVTSDATDSPFILDFEEVGAGVWAAVRPDGPRFPVMGTTTFVVSDAGVVVFDGGGLAIMADKVIQKIRALTDAPVTHVVISHWHGDHNFGNYRYAEAYPNVQFVAHSFTDAVMRGSRIRYIDGYAEFIEKNLPRYKKTLADNVHPDGNPVEHIDRIEFERIIEHAELIDVEYRRARVTPPTVVFDDALTIVSGERRIELRKLGHGNTEGDIVMWLPQERIVATGDIVVLPTPYAFNVPPRPWAETLRAINALNYDVLIPGHGAIQRDTRYVDLNIEAAESIATQRDRLLDEGLSHEEIQQQLDFSAFEDRFTKGDPYTQGFYDAYFEQPFRAAAIKALTGERMVPIERN